MPIKGLTEPERRRLPRIGKIHLGIMAETAKGIKYPKATDYFVYPKEEASGGELVDELVDKFGEQPKELRVIFPLEDEERIASQYYRCYSKTRGLICKGDGEKSTRMVDTQSGLMADRDSKKVEMKEMICDGRKCPDYEQGKCREMMMLQFMLPEISGLGIWQIDTGSINSIRNVNASLDMVRAVYNRISMVPLVLALEQIEVTNPDDGKKKKVHVMALRSPDNMIAAAMKARMEPLKLVVGMTGENLIDTPEADDERPGPTVVRDWEGHPGDPIDPVVAAIKVDEQSLWPEDEKERMAPEESADRMTPAEVTQATSEAEAELFPEDDMPTISQHDKLPVGKAGGRLRVIETEEILYWHPKDKGGSWLKNPPEATTSSSEASSSPADAKLKTDTAAPKTYAELLAFVASKGKTYGPTWFHNQSSFTAEVLKADTKKVTDAYLEIKAIAGW